MNGRSSLKTMYGLPSRSSNPKNKALLEEGVRQSSNARNLRAYTIVSNEQADEQERNEAVLGERKKRKKEEEVTRNNDRKATHR